MQHGTNVNIHQKKSKQINTVSGACSFIAYIYKNKNYKASEIEQNLSYTQKSKRPEVNLKGKSRVASVSGDLGYGRVPLVGKNKINAELLTERISGKGKLVRRVVLSCKDCTDMVERDRLAANLPQLAREWRDTFAPGSRYICAVHIDRKHVHAHVLLENWNAAKGKRWDWRPHQLERMQDMDWHSMPELFVCGRGSMPKLGVSKEVEVNPRAIELQKREAPRTKVKNELLAVAYKTGARTVEDAVAAVKAFIKQSGGRMYARGKADAITFVHNNIKVRQRIFEAAWPEHVQKQEQAKTVILAPQVEHLVVQPERVQVPVPSPAPVPFIKKQVTAHKQSLWDSIKQLGSKKLVITSSKPKKRKLQVTPASLPVPQVQVQMTQPPKPVSIPEPSMEKEIPKQEVKPKEKTPDDLVMEKRNEIAAERGMDVDAKLPSWYWNKYMSLKSGSPEEKLFVRENHKKAKDEFKETMSKIERDNPLPSEVQTEKEIKTYVKQLAEKAQEPGKKGDYGSH